MKCSTGLSGVVCKEEGGPGVVCDGSERRMGAVTPGETLGTLYNIRVGTNKTKQHNMQHVQSTCENMQHVQYAC